MDKSYLKVIIAIGLICLLMGVLIGVGIAMIPEEKCVRNPLNYGISQLETENLKVSCNCHFNDFTYAPFFFNETGVFPYGGN
jgi:hypothetical protein